MGRGSPLLYLSAAGPPTDRQGSRMFTFKLELENDEAAEPAKFVTAVPGWAPGDRVLIRPGLAYRVVEAREGVLVVEHE